MGTYTVRAPDGKMVTLQGPDGASHADIVAQAQKLYRPRSTPNPLLQRYTDLRNSVAAKISDPTLRARSLQNFDADPRVQQLRQAAGLAPLSTAQGEVKAVARKSVQQRVADAGQDLGSGSTAPQSLSAGVARGTFGIPEILAAAGERFLPSALTGNNTNASFGNILQMIRAKDSAAIDAHPVAGGVGELGGAVVGGNVAGRAIMGGASRLAAAGSPALARVAQAVQSVGTFNKGQKLVNAGKLATIGGTAGGAQAAGQGTDIPTGAVEGAVAAPLVAGGAKAAGAGLMRFGQILSAPFTDVLKLPNAARVLGKITGATTAEMQAEAARIRAVNPNANPTLFELLPLADRNRIMSEAASKNDTVAEQAGAAITARAKQLAPEMQARVSRVLQPNRQAIHDGLINDLTTARGGKLQEGDADIAAKAMNSTTDMQAFRKTEADAYMAPHNDKIVGSLNDLIPSTAGPDGTRLEVDPETSNAIRSVAGSARSVPTKPLPVSRVVDMIHSLKKPNATLDPNVAADAEEHLQGLLHGVDPDVAEAAQNMNAAYAGRSRMIEGMSAGGKTQLRDTIDTGTNGRNGRLVTNSYDTPEGEAGRALGQGNTLLSDLGAGPGPALRLTNDIAGTNNDIGREIGQNLGPDAAPIVSAAKAQASAGQALGSAANKISGGGDDNTTPLQTLTQVAAALHPTSFAATKAGAVKKLMGMMSMPANRASTIVDMVFSQDPTLQAKAVQALGNQSTTQFVKYLAGVTGQTAAMAGAPDTYAPAPAATTDIPPEPAAVEQPVPASAAEAPADQTQASSPYAPILLQTYQNENPDMISLVQRVKQQESRGDQKAVSSKGAIGRMQVMPATGPEAAKLAGVPWDEQAFHNDGTYNEILGHAYLANLLRKYKGDVGQALAAYNAGPGAVDNALSTHGDNFLTALPAETQDYVQKVS